MAGAPEGNQNAARGKEFRAALQRALAKRADGQGWVVALDKIANKLLDLAESGEQWAVQELANRIDGKPATIIVGAEDQPPVRFARVVRVIRKP